MVFSSLIFIFVFLPVILFFYYGILQNHSYRNFFLLLVSIFFYAWGEPYYFVIILLSIVVNFKAGLLMEEARADKNQRRETEIMWAGIFFNLFFLFFFKYEGFVVRNINSVMQYSALNSLELPLPIGISFFTFQAISYLVDVYRKAAPVQHSFVGLGLYIAFFPQLVAGPIVRYTTIAKQIQERQTTYAQFNLGVKRFILGLGKKIVFANQFSLIATESFQSPSPSVTLAWLGAFAYSLQIYYDFSGYSDMAIGLGKMFGFDFLENFRYPFISKTVTDFWRRWHISLGSWFRDYVYIPLGGSRVSKPRMVFNSLVVWTLTGVWHGAAWNFVAWGLLYFVLLTMERYLPIDKWRKNIPFAIMYQVFTLVSFIVGCVIFGEGSLMAGLEHIGFMFHFVNNHTLLLIDDALRFLRNYWMLLLLASICATPVIPVALSLVEKKSKKLPEKYQFTYQFCYEYLGSLLYIGLFFISISYLVINAHNPFIYFNF